MKKITCNVVRDLLPLYAEDLLSDDSVKLVQDHLEDCPDCQAYLKDLQADQPIETWTDSKPLFQAKKSLQKKRWLTGLLAVLLTLLVGILGMTFLTAPIYHSYDDQPLTIHESDDGMVTISFDQDVDGYSLNESEVDGVYSITTWTSSLDRLINGTSPGDTVVNPDGEIVESIYFYTEGEGADHLIYGQDLYVNGDIMTLPRLTLSYAFIAAGGLFIILAAIAYFNRSHPGRFKFLIQLTGLPLAYLTGHLLVKGFDSATYSLARDFSAISLVGLVIYSIYWLIIHRLFSQKSE